MSAPPARGYLSISEVLAQLRADFPDISVSKIRFLEAEGLIAPARSPAGYRRFCSADVDRLRVILTAQRDQYLPLRVIRERLDHLGEAADGPDGAAGARVNPGPPRPRGAVGTASPGTPNRTGPNSTGPHSTASPTRPGGGADEAAPMLSRRDLLDGSGMSEALLTELETFGLLRRYGRFYRQDALEVARTAVALTAFGVEARHLRAVRAAAERETTMIESLVAPILRQRGAGARELAGRTARECAVQVLRLHGALVAGALAEAGLAAAGLGDAAMAGPAIGDMADAGPPMPARGVEGASA
ncbi:MAG TPA: MerR family transcriptional regulator [Streptosporangiaceae bacterium]|nr:MerR family transcriptional regulator [Streptosporangiaceae bacterium]